ncbi:MAG: carboxypeptidase regulatory-like domain-containing protein, partial [Victivallales bacterium]|nr:carboxypeptidase regulatory-like domain-containing protein [Victivallales bacterium]
MELSVFCAEEATSQIVSFRESRGRPLKKPHQHHRLDATVGLGAPGKAIGLDELGLGIALDTLWAPDGGSQEFIATMNADWKFTKKDLNKLNTSLARKEGLGGNLCLGAIQVTTKEVFFRRQLGFSTDVGLDVKVKGEWHNNVAKVTVADLGVNIEDKCNEKIGPKTGKGNITGVDTSDSYFHKDTVNVTDLPGLVQSASKTISGLLNKVSSNKTLVEKVVDFAAKKALKFVLGVIVTQKTYDRRMEFDLTAWAKDMEGNTIGLTMREGSKHIVISDEKRSPSIYATMPEDCPPLKEITLSIQNAKYFYSDHGNVEIGVRSDAFYVTTGPMTEGFFDPLHHEIKAENETRLRVVADDLLFVPCHGRVESGNPPAPIQGATVKVEAKDKSFKFEDITDPAGRFLMDFYVPVAKGNKNIPPFNISAEKQGYATYKTDNKSAYYDDGNIVLSLHPPEVFCLSGIVKDAQGKGISDAEVFLDGVTAPTVVSDTQGRYRFGWAPYTDKKVTVTAQRTGYNFKPVTLDLKRGKKEQSLEVDIVAEGAALIGTVRCVFSISGKASLPGSVGVTKGDGTSFDLPLEKDRSINIPVIDHQTESLAFSKEGYSFNPATVNAKFSGKGMEKKTFNIKVTAQGAQSVALALSPSTIETRGGVAFPDYRPEELSEAIAVVKDSAKNPLSGVLVKFESIKGSAAIAFLKDGKVSDVGFATSDVGGKAAVQILANRTGEARIMATSLERIEND